MNNILCGRLAAIGILCFLWAVFFCFYKAMLLYRDDQLRRIVYGVICIGTAIALLFSQIGAYISITHIERPIDKDLYFFCILVIEWGLPIFPLFIFLARQGRHKE